MNIKHNKIRNTGILFELLTRHMTADVLRGKETSMAEVVMERHFNPKTELGKELLLYRSFFNIHELTEGKSFKFIALLLEQRAKLDETKLAKQKFNLIKDIKNNYDLKEFCSIRVPAYKIYASIYQLFETAKDDAFYEVDAIAKAQFTLVEHLVGKPATASVEKEQQIFKSFRNKTKADRIKSYVESLEEFNSKYANLMPEQRNLLQEYAYSLTKTGKIQKLVVAEAKKIHTDILKSLGLVENTVTQIKLREVLQQLTKLQEIEIVEENHVTAMLFAYEIHKELKNMGILND